MSAEPVDVVLAEVDAAVEERPVLVPELGFYPEIPEDRYHADDSLAPELGRSLSSSGAKTLVARTPAHYQHERTHGRPDTKAFDHGHAAHRFILGRGNDIARIPDAYLGRDGSASTALAKAFIAEARATSRVPLKTAEYLAALDMAKAVKRHPEFGALFKAGLPEVSWYWSDPATGVTCRARADWLHPGAIVDVKTTVDASPAGFAKSAANFRYDISAATYVEGYRVLTGKVLPFVLVCVEKTPPHLTAAYVLPADALAAGLEDWHLALSRFAACESTGSWPAYPTEIQTLDLPNWFYYRRIPTS